MRHSAQVCRIYKTASLAALLLAIAIAQEGRLPEFTVAPLHLPGASGLVMLDYFAYDPTTRLLWVPAANTGSVDVIDTATDQIRTVTGFAVKQVELRGKVRSVGPSSVAIGEGAIYIGSRADSQICTIDAHSLKRRTCTAFAPPSAGMAAAPDGLIYIAATHELWATSGAPPIGIPAADHSVKIFSASQNGRLKLSSKIPLTGSAEGYAVDNIHGRFYTNVEETGETVAIDVRKRAVVSTWLSCNGPSGVAVDSKRGFVFVACTDRVLILDTAHGGRVVGSVATGDGVDNIDFAEATGELYAAAGDAAQLTVAHIDDHGRATVVAKVLTVKGARSVVAGARGCAYLIDPYGGNILAVNPK